MDYYSKASETAKAVKAKFGELRVSVCGSWVWIGGTEKENETQVKYLKSLGGRWSKGKEKWYIKGAPSSSKRRYSYQEIVQRHGEEEIAV